MSMGARGMTAAMLESRLRSNYGTTGTVDDVVSVDTGLQLSELAGHAFIVHGWYGERIACALLVAPTPAPSS